MTGQGTTENRPRVVVGVDGSAGSVHALRKAGELSSALGAHLDVVAVWEPPIEFGWTLPVALRTREWRAEYTQIAEQAIAEAFAATPPPDLTIHIREGYPSAELVHLSEGAQMLVVGSRGHGTLTSALLGSVGVRCVEQAHCPVLVVRPELSAATVAAAATGSAAAAPAPALPR